MDRIEHDKPPVFKSWNHWYALVIGALVLQVLVYCWLTFSFS
jgi:hypothetical protein